MARVADAVLSDDVPPEHVVSTLQRLLELPHPSRAAPIINQSAIAP
jgi:hypothetical protein